MSASIETLLKNHLSKFSSAPFLFIGSGFSRRYIQLEDWQKLLKVFCNELPQNFQYYNSSANGDLPKVASLMAEDFFDIWWKEEAYAESRKANSDYALNRSSPLKIEISNYLKNRRYEYDKNEKLDIEIEALKNIVIDGIITTNWDSLLESDLFSEQISTTYVGQEELIFSNPKEISEIYKIHGSLTDPNSLILTSDDYSAFKKKNPYLAAKLMTIFMEHPIIFIGYSMSDDNIIEILQAITSCLNEDNLSKLKDRLIFLHRDSKNEGDSFQNASMTIGENTLMITRITTNDFSQVYRGLSHIKRKIPAKILRQVKSQIYELVKTNDPNEKIYGTIDFEDNVKAEDLEFVFGVGVKDKFSEIGYNSISSDDLFKEVVTENSTYNYKLLVEKTLPEQLTRDSYIPIFKICSMSGISKTELEKNKQIKNKLADTLENLLTNSEKNKSMDIQKNYFSISDLEKQFCNPSDLFDRIILLKPSSINKEYLRNLILENIHFLSKSYYDNPDVPEKSQTRSSFRKLIRFYDMIFYSSEI